MLGRSVATVPNRTLEEEEERRIIRDLKEARLTCCRAALARVSPRDLRSPPLFR